MLKAQVSLATTLLTKAPDLAEAVSAGRLGLSLASAMARPRQAPSPSPGLSGDAVWLPPVFLTVTEAAARLSRHRSAVLRMLHAGQLRSVRLGHSYRIPEADVHRIAAGQQREGRALTVEECARILRCSPATVYSLLHHGHLVGERNGAQGNFRIPVTEFQRFISSVTR